MIIGQVQHDENNLGGIHSGLISAQRGGNKKNYSSRILALPKQALRRELSYLERQLRTLSSSSSIARCSTRTICSWTSAMFSEFVTSLRHRLHHRRMDPSRARDREPFKAVQAARLGVPQLYPDIRLEEVRSSSDAAGTSLGLESTLGIGVLQQGGNISKRRVAFPL